MVLFLRVWYWLRKWDSFSNPRWRIFLQKSVFKFFWFKKILEWSFKKIMFPLFQNRGISESVKQESLDIVDSATRQIVNIYIYCHCIYVYWNRTKSNTPITLYSAGMIEKCYLNINLLFIFALSYFVININNRVSWKVIIMESIAPQKE